MAPAVKTAPRENIMSASADQETSFDHRSWSAKADMMSSLACGFNRQGNAAEHAHV
jgi:hypothetical protein